MATAAQTRANQANAKKSTGPKTKEGKAKVAGNHTTHGLFIRRHVILPGEDPAEYDALLADSPSEDRNALAQCEWRIRRCQRAEAMHRREKLRLLAAERTQLPPAADTSKPMAAVISNPTPEPTVQRQAVTSKPIASSLPKQTQSGLVTSNPIAVFDSLKPIPATPTTTITYGLPPRYVQELRQLKRTQSTLDPARDQGRLSPSLRLYTKDRNHLTQVRQFLKSAA